MSAEPSEPTGWPRTPAQAREAALAWVACLLATGYTVEKAEEMPFDAGGRLKVTAGYSIFNGKIHIPKCWERLINGRVQAWSFSFRVLAAELEAPEQAELFKSLP